jgi:hypothetical protein
MGTEITRIGLIKNLISLVFIIPVAILQTIKIRSYKVSDDWEMLIYYKYIYIDNNITDSYLYRSLLFIRSYNKYSNP